MKHRTLVRARRRKGRCYELALKALNSKEASGFLLVHGQCRGPNDSRVGHAWLFDPENDLVYDPVLDRWFSEAGYRDFVAAVPERMYTLEQALKAALAASPSTRSAARPPMVHVGPWHDSD